MKKYFITTFGCQMNEHDSENIAGMLESKGYTSCDSRDDADIVIMNTCSIRENADKRFFGTLGQLKKKKEKNRDFIVCVCGCMPQQQIIIDKIKAHYNWVDIIFGTQTIEEFPELLDKRISKGEKQTAIINNNPEIPGTMESRRLFKHKALVNVTYGCNNFCTYCIVPYTRGREKSRTLDSVVNEIKELVADGVIEVTLLGQNVNSFRDPDGRDFPDLVRAVNEIEGLKRIRFMTSHPKDLSDKLIECYKDCSKLCNHIHLPVQSGSTDVLKHMNRKYTREHYLQVADKIHRAVPGVAVTTDIIVGFPGETEKDFEDTLSLVRAVKYDAAFTFIYSVRKGTPAATFPDQIKDTIQHERFNRLAEVVNEESLKKNMKLLNTTVEVLVDGLSKNNKNKLSGRTDDFKLVNFEGSKDNIGKLVKVKVTKSKSFSLEGELVI